MPRVQHIREGRAREVRRVLRLVLWLNLTVIGLKLLAWWSSQALSVVAELSHSSLDALNNLFALGMVRIASKEPDDDHPYGHQKFETLGALVLVGVLSVTMFELGRRAVEKLLAGSPPAVTATPLALGLMVFSVAAGVAITRYEHRKGRALGSDLLLADAAHTRADVLATLAVLAGLLAVRAGYPRADPWITLAVAVLIGRTGWHIVREAVPVLVDERAVHPARIRGVAEGVDRVLSAHSIRSRGRPGEIFAELTITVAADLDVSTSHEVADQVERRVAEDVGARKVVVHVEPFG